ncbi:MAG: type IV secretory system conjugative DNA transfer family protein [Pseudomonadota bacterium]
MAAPFHASPGLYATGLLASLGAAEIGRAYEHGLFEILGWALTAGFAVATLAETARRVLRLFAWHQVKAKDKVFGRADFASRGDLKRAGLLGTRSADGIFLGAAQGALLCYAPQTHLLTVAPAGGGKTSGIALPNLLHTTALAGADAARSMVVTGKDGELSGMMYRRAKAMMPSSVIINPYGILGLPNDGFNPLQRCLDLAADGSPDVVLAAEGKMKILIHEPEHGGDNGFFRVGGRQIGSYVTCYLAIVRPEDCHLPKLQELVSSGDADLMGLLMEMSQSDVADGYCARGAKRIQSLMVNSERTFAGQIAELQQALAIFDGYSTLAKSITRSEFKPSVIKEQPSIVFIELPEDKVDILAPYVALVIDELVRAGMDHPSKQPTVHFLMDEFQRLPVMDSLVTGLFRGRSSGLIFQPIIQDFQSLKKYGDNASAYRTQSDVVQMFGIRAVPDAEYLETRIGQQTVETANLSLPQGAVDQFQVNHGAQGAPRLRKDEILQTPQGLQYIVHKSDPVILGEIVPWWEVDPWRGWPNDNPKEGGAPPGRPRYRIRYRRQS